MLIGSARISTEYQKFDSQIQPLLNAGVDERNIFKEQVSGASLKRPELQKVLSFIREGDTLVVFKLDRLSRSLQDLINLLSKLNKKKVIFKSLTENIETETALGKMLFNIIGTLAEFERSIISERVKAGIQAAKKKGIYFGGVIKVGAIQKEQIRELLKKHRSKYDIMKILGLKSRTPIYKLIKDDLAKEKGEVNIAPSLEFKGLN